MEEYDDLDTFTPYTDEEFSKVYKAGTDFCEIAEKNKLTRISDLDDGFEIPAQGFFSIAVLRLSATNTNPRKPEMKDLSPALALVEMILHVFPEDEYYSHYACEKAEILFKMGHMDEAEDYIKEYLKKNPLDAHAYMEFATYFDGIGHNKEKAVEYLRMGLSQEGMEGREELEDFLSDYEE